MRRGVDGNDVRERADAATADFRDDCLLDLEHRDNAGLSSHIKCARHGIECQDVRRFPCIERLDNLHRAHVQDEEFVVTFAHDKGQPVTRVDQQAMVAMCSRQVDARYDPVGAGFLQAPSPCNC